MACRRALVVAPLVVVRGPTLKSSAFELAMAHVELFAAMKQAAKVITLINVRSSPPFPRISVCVIRQPRYVDRTNSASPETYRELLDSLISSSAATPA